MPNKQILQQTAFGEAGYFIKNKAIPFFKQGLLIPFIFATLLYILMRVFFIGSEFDTRESIELYLKTVLVTWAYITLWRLICVAIIWLEGKTAKVKINKVITMNMLKKTAVLILVCGLTYAVKARSYNMVEQSNVHAVSIENNDKEASIDVDPKFYFWMK